MSALLPSRFCVALLLGWLAAVGGVTGLAVVEGASIWQVTLRYEAAGEWELLDAKVAPLAKEGSLSAGTRTTLARWEWIDAQGETLLDSEIRLPLQVSVPLAESGPSPVSWVTPPSGVLSARVWGPDDPEAVAGARLLMDASDGMTASSYSLSLPEERLALLSTDGTGPVGSYQLRDTGANAERLVFVLMGDGYLQEDIDSGLYREHAEATLAAFENVAPWDVLLNGTNVHVVEIVSAERGASKEDGPNGTMRDTYFQTAFHSGGIERLLVAEGNGVALARAAADEALGVGAWDQIVMMVNSSKYGGSGGSIAVHSMNVNGPRVSIHEVGHSYAGLADEYDYADGEIWSGSRPGEANVDTDLENLKWADWLDGGVPVPTPDASEWNGRVGAFEGAKYKEFGVYRPQRHCMMRSISSPFCKVCVERHVQRYFELLGDELGYAKRPLGQTPVSVANVKSFSLALPEFSGNRVRWYLDGELLNGAEGTAFALSRGQLGGGTKTLSAEWSYDDSVVKKGALKTYSWEVLPFEGTVLGTPYWWLESFGFDAQMLGVDAVDHDRDGYTTAEEYLANTDPTNPASRIALLRFGSSDPEFGYSLLWALTPDRAFTLERSQDLANWLAVPGFEAIESPFAGGVSYEVPRDWLAYYYRLKVEMGESGADATD
ncbi:M64 family metallopeptidase [Pelagicoccus enzymogenes]|uniref:M64 family metallopeptidase n=1 Tax=Pelagicoccus enzymogenes TaxID=2773457 RepID=UPI00280FEDE7|nr:M64 family metallopeptidase [Pelagicoccus enzymogenes]MDQ8198109.1 M64 family metallopeptidase [Pelagicoccus enzymogenes]